jgi:hypothetical protein
MRQRLVLVLVAMFLTAFTAEAQVILDAGTVEVIRRATLTVEKSGSCSGTVVVRERDTGNRVVSCGIGCDEKTVAVPVGTWLRIDTTAMTRCGGGLLRSTVMKVCPNRTRTCDFQLQPEGTTLKASFVWNNMVIGGFDKDH